MIGVDALTEPPSASAKMVSLHLHGLCKYRDTDRVTCISLFALGCCLCHACRAHRSCEVLQRRWNQFDRFAPTHAVLQATKEWKFSVMEAIMRCKERGMLGEDMLESFRNHLKQGPFWVPSKTREVTALE